VCYTIHVLNFIKYNINHNPLEKVKQCSNLQTTYNFEINVKFLIVTLEVNSKNIEHNRNTYYEFFENIKTYLIASTTFSLYFINYL